MTKKDPQTILRLTDFKTYFESDGGVVRAVDGISFVVKTGQTLGIVGESGSGKTVTGLSIMGLVDLSNTQNVDGGIQYRMADGQLVDLVKIAAKDFRKIRGKEIAMIFQEPMSSLNPVMRCGDQITEMILLHKGIDKKMARQEVLRWFERVKLPTPERIFDAYPHQLSGGQKQRVMIAMALSCDPQILVADEPTTALDVTVQQSILNLMKELQESLGITIIFISHDLGVIRQIADDVVVMQNGLIVEQGTVEAVFRNPRHPYTKGLLACRPPLGRRLRRLPTVADFLNGEVTEDGLKNNILSEDEMKTRLSNLSQKEPLLKVENLEVSFGGQKRLFRKNHETVEAVKNVSFEVYPGETLGLVGESGCGKTTLSRAILRLIDTQVTGRAYYAGKDVFGLSSRAMQAYRKGVQIIFQDHYASLNPRKMVGSAIMEVLKLHQEKMAEKVMKEKVMDLLEMVGMEPFHFSRYPHELSGGQRQRICIARALAVKPEFIICDEPVSALDVSVQAQVLNLLKDLQEKLGLTYIFISHDLSVVKFMSDRMLVMQNGQIVESGPSDQIYANPQELYTRALIAAVPE